LPIDSIEQKEQPAPWEGDVHTRTIAFSTKPETDEIEFGKWDFFFIVSRTTEASGGQAIIRYPGALDSGKEASAKTFAGSTEEEAVKKAIAWVEKFYPTEDDWVKKEW
jgi:hypothetical protein